MLLQRSQTTFITFDTNSINELLEYCKQEFSGAILGGSSSTREQLLNVWKQTGVKPKELENLTETPTELLEQWGWFLDLNDSRSSNGYGYNPISFSDMYAYFRLQGVNPHLWEVSLIRRLDRVVLGV